ncbi:hypothetical protein [Georgfuchsia toluolica]|uniref:hypothetical protein n=1 Tax=Georgfuchsia toluolica TaxID=424218 RepID=UPI001C730138|nr:hypothetical protein [Georgfuchsia toluolica]
MHGKAGKQREGEKAGNALQDEVEYLHDDEPYKKQLTTAARRTRRKARVKALTKDTEKGKDKLRFMVLFLSVVIAFDFRLPAVSPWFELIL